MNLHIEHCGTADAQLHRITKVTRKMDAILQSKGMRPMVDAEDCRLWLLKLDLDSWQTVARHAMVDSFTAQECQKVLAQYRERSFLNHYDRKLNHVTTK